jgi:gluconokinase
VIQRPLAVPSVQEASALGAAELAMVATGALGSVEDTRRFATIGPELPPNPANAAVYDRLYTLYMQVYWQLTEQFAEIARFQREAIH